jgi:hemerythrin-like metal-binding protein
MHVVAISGETVDCLHVEEASDPRSAPLQLKWLDVFETGNAEIDRIHRKLLADCNALLSIISAGAGWPVIIVRAKRLVEDCVAHFRLEESILGRTQFARLAEHQAEHQRLEHEMRRAVERMEKRDDAFSDRFEHARWLGGLLVDAIVRNDLDFRSHILNEQGR